MSVEEGGEQEKKVERFHLSGMIAAARGSFKSGPCGMKNGLGSFGVRLMDRVEVGKAAGRLIST